VLTLISIEFRYPKYLINPLVLYLDTFLSDALTVPPQAFAWATWKSMRNASCVSSLFSSTRFKRGALAGGILAVAATLGGCYVVPVQPAHTQGAVVYAHTAPPLPVPPAPPAPVTFAARLYPANDLAAGVGMVGAVVTNDLNGRGTFSATINGESFTGEATRGSGSSREGVANGAGNRGSFLNCRYQMNSATLGSGQCKLSNGALFTMHVGG
jgi:hypothetical protein